MTTMELMVLFLVISFCLSQAFWVWQLHKLLNKVMSKDYREYTKVKVEEIQMRDQIKKQSKETKKAADDRDPYAEKQAEELNRLFGMV